MKLTTKQYKKYILFCYETYHPEGGLNDIHNSYNTLEEAVEILEKMEQDYREIVDRDTWEIIYDSCLGKIDNTEKPEETDKIQEMIISGQSPSFSMHNTTHSMGLKFGQEEKYPDIKHHTSNEQPIAIPHENLNKIKHILPNGTVIRK